MNIVVQFKETNVEFSSQYHFKLYVQMGIKRAPILT